MNENNNIRPETIADLKVSEIIKLNLRKKGIIKLTDVQAECIPSALEGKDILGISKTGSGKTAAFLVPIIEKIISNKNLQQRENNIEALIIAPSRELAAQIKLNADEISRSTGVEFILLHGGGGKISENREAKTLRNKKNICGVIGTMGRIESHINNKNLNLSNVKYFVLDEVDAMLKEGGFFESVQSVYEKLTNREKQVFLFSATFQNERTRQLAKNFLKENKVMVEVKSKPDEVSDISEKYILTGDADKSGVLLNLIKIDKKNHNTDGEKKFSAMIFVNTKIGVREVTEFLGSNGISCQMIHGELSQERRTKTMLRFKKNIFEILVGTDVAGRGIDIQDLSHVYNFGFPSEREDYIHRIGRTGRAGKKGKSTILISDRDQRTPIKLERGRKVGVVEFIRNRNEKIEEIKIGEIIPEMKDVVITEKSFNFENSGESRGGFRRSYNNSGFNRGVRGRENYNIKKKKW